MVRDIDRIDPLPDEKLKQIDKEYLETHQLDKLFGEVLSGILSSRPGDPVQYIIDYISFAEAAALQDQATGLPAHRKAKLMEVFAAIDKAQSGFISLKHLQAFSNKYGGDTLTGAELGSIFEDFRPSTDTEVGVTEFLVFWGKVSRTIPNSAFDDMIADLLG